MAPKRKRKGQAQDSTSKKIKHVEENMSSMQKYFKTALHCVDMPGNQKSFSPRQCELWFLNYADNNSSNPIIGPDGIEKFCKDIEVQPEDIVMLVLSWKLGAENMGYYKLTEWKVGMTSLECDNTSKLKNKIDFLRATLKDSGSFKKIYRYAFDFSRDKEQKSLDIDTGKAMLQLLLGNTWNLTSDFLEFLNQSKYKIINRDQWNSLLEFIRTINTDDFQGYDNEGAWPVMLDEFVEWYQEKKTMS